MESPGLCEIKGRERPIYAAFKNRSDDGISGDRKKPKATIRFGRALMPSS